MKEFISYAAGCMFGRYSLDQPGLVLANQGETAADYRRQVPEPSFPLDEDNVIPMLDGDWFTYDTELEGWSISGGFGAPLSVFGLGNVAPGFVSLDLSSNGQDASATARVRIPLGGGE